MMLSDVDILHELTFTAMRGDGMGGFTVAEPGLSIQPWDSSMLQPASVDFSLGDEFLVFDNYEATAIDPMDQQDYTKLVTSDPGGQFVLHPGDFVLGKVNEFVRIPPHLLGRIEGKSSLGRLGLLIHATAGFIDPGFEGCVTLELANVAQLPIILRPGMKIAQMSFSYLKTPAARPYGSKGLGSKYQGDRSPRASQYHRNGPLPGHEGVDATPRHDADL